MQFENLLKVICESSARSSTAALSKFLKLPLNVNIMPVEIKQPNEINLYVDKEDLIVKLFVPITGKLPGYCFFLFPKQSALALCDHIFHKKSGATQEINENEQSGLFEIANILIGNFLTSFAQALHSDYLMQRPTDFSIGSYTHIYDQIQSTFAPSMRRESIVKIAFEYQCKNIQGFVVFAFEIDDVNEAFQLILKDSSS